MDRTPDWPPPADADPKRVAKWARGRMTAAGAPRPTRVVAELLPGGNWRLLMTFTSPPTGAAEAACAAVAPVPAEITQLVFRG
jgi:hypothetical protein